ncbi:MAG: hypothetical protein HN348_27715, partial [Proteobacteria bacterium]|nr:hypothetical protein [Pseudomonadota bacterium]
MIIPRILFVVPILALLVVGVLAYDVVRKMSGSGIILGIGLFGLFLGERVFGDGSAHMLVSSAAVAVVIGNSNYTAGRIP